MKISNKKCITKAANKMIIVKAICLGHGVTLLLAELVHSKKVIVGQ